MPVSSTFWKGSDDSSWGKIENVKEEKVEGGTNVSFEVKLTSVILIVLYLIPIISVLYLY